MRDDAVLEKNETVLWDGRPDTRLRFGLETMATGIFAMAMVLGCLGLATVIDRSSPGVYWTILGPGLILGLAVVLTFPILDSLKRARTRYRLTDQRIVIQRGNLNRSYPIPPAVQIQLRGTAPQTITFGHDRRNRPISLERLDDAAEVYVRLRALAAERHPA